MRQIATAMSLMLAAALVATGCGRASETPARGKELRVLTSTFPMTLFTRAVAAGREGIVVESMLPGSMGCPHDYVLTPEDMRRIADADVLVANGLGMENYLGAPVERANPHITVLDSSKGVAGRLRMTPEEGAGDEHGHGEFNPHLFASPRTAAAVVRNIAAELATVDPAGAEVYRRNAEAYAAKLDALADELAAAGKKLRLRKIVTQHAVFDYLARDAGLEIVAVIEEMPGQEPSAAQMLDIVKRIKAGGAAAVFTEPQYPPKVAETIAKEAGVPVAGLDPVASGPDDAPLDYYETVMRRNLDTLKKTLGVK